MTIPFTHFIGIDWSGAKSRNLRGLQVARLDAGSNAPTLVVPEESRHWSRAGVADYIRSCTAGACTLIGIDSSFSLPFGASGYLGGDLAGCADAPALWAAVDRHAQTTPHLGCDGFVEAFADWFHMSAYKGAHVGEGPKYRATEQACVQAHGLRPEVYYKLIGPSQVGRTALTTMRVLHSLAREPDIAIWPFQDIRSARIVIVELYAALFAAIAGHRGKVRTPDQLAAILAHWGCPHIGSKGDFPGDDAADALIMAAGLRVLSMQDRYWQPGGEYSKVRQTEGWIFGVG